MNANAKKLLDDQNEETKKLFEAIGAPEDYTNKMDFRKARKVLAMCHGIWYRVRWETLPQAYKDIL